MRRCLFWMGLVAILLSGCNSSHQETKTDPPADEVADVTVVEPEIQTGNETLPEDAPVLKFTVEQLHEALAAGDFNTVAAGHWLELTGVVHCFRQEGGTGAPGAYVTLREPGEFERREIPKRADIIMASLDEAWGKLRPGDEATIRFQLSQWSGFYDGKVVSGGGEPVPRATAQELVEAVKADKAAAREKYHDQYWIVTGTMADKQPYSDGFSFGFDKVYFSAVMKGDDQTSIALELPHVRVLQRLEPQEEVEVLGKVMILDEENVTEQKPYYIGIVDGSRIDVDAF